MIHPLQSKRSVILSGMIAAATLLLSTEGAQAGAAELKALTAQLASAGVTPATASAQQLADAVKAVINANTKFKPGVVAGEALKAPGSTSNSAGDEIAAAVLSANGVLATDRAAITKITADAAKTAGTSKGANVSQVASFSQATLNTNDEARSAAVLAIGSKSGAGAILGGRASELATDALRQDLVNGAFTDKKLQGAATDISREVARTVSDTDQFAKNIATTTQKLAGKIALGVASADPQNAGAIVSELVNSPDAALQTIVLKGAASIVKSVSAVADIEQIVFIGKAYADKIGQNAVGTGTKPLLAATKAASLVKTLTKAILSKPIVGGTSNRNTVLNKADEIAEVAAYFANGIIGSTKITPKTAPKLFLAIIKAAVAGGKASKKQTALDAKYISDIAGSVALTVQNSGLSAETITAIRNFLLDSRGKQAKSIGGSNAPAVISALTLGFSDSVEANTRLENGTLNSAADLALLNDPETDIHNF